MTHFVLAIHFFSLWNTKDYFFFSCSYHESQWGPVLFEVHGLKYLILCFFAEESHTGLEQHRDE